MTHTEVYKQYHIDPPQHRHSHTGLHTPTIRVLAFLPPQSTSRSLSDSHPSANSSSCCRPCCSAGIELQHDKNTVSLVVPADVLTVPVAGQSHDDVPATMRADTHVPTYMTCVHTDLPTYPPTHRAHEPLDSIHFHTYHTDQGSRDCNQATNPTHHSQILHVI